MVVRLSSKGQIVLPADVRAKLNLQQGDEIEVHVEDGHIVLTPVENDQYPDWLDWQGILAGTNALSSHLADHADWALELQTPLMTGDPELLAVQTKLNLQIVGLS